jgi:glycosyltransferase involved in cell wall biosynthesis
MLVKLNFTNSPQVEEFVPQQNLPLKIKQQLTKIYLKISYKPYHYTRPPKYADPFSFDITPFDGKNVLSQVSSADILNLHWVALFIDYKSFFSAVHQPVVWTLHDMNAFTGGCHYNDTCFKFREHCSRCPQLGSRFNRDIAYQSFERKREIFENFPSNQLHLVALSNWMKQELSTSPLLNKFPVTIIPNSLDISVYSQRDRTELRKIFGISEEKFVLLCTAQLNSNFRKGYHLLSEALQYLASYQEITERIIIMTIGHKPLLFPNSFEQINLGFIKHEGLMSAIYNIADLFMLPSLQDNLPNTMLEAMACGTPVIGFKVGGIPDAVLHKETGYIVDKISSESLASAIDEIVQTPKWILGIRDKCRKHVENNYGPEIQANRYASLYQQLHK